MTTKKTTTGPVDIADLVRHRDYQIRKKLDGGTVHRYATIMRGGNLMPPVRVAIVNGAKVLVDGFHRVAAAEQAERSTVEAEIVEDVSPEEARWLAVEANLTHGLPLKAKEVREGFKVYIKARKHKDGKRYKSYREIAADLGGSRHFTTIRNWMRRCFPHLFRIYSAGDDTSLRSEKFKGAPPCSFTVIASEGLEQARAASKAKLTPWDRGDLVQQAEGVTETIKGGGEWSRPDF